MKNRALPLHEDDVGICALESSRPPRRRRQSAITASTQSPSLDEDSGLPRRRERRAHAPGGQCVAQLRHRRHLADVRAVPTARTIV
jgi:hypothetical protein